MNAPIFETANFSLTTTCFFTLSSPVFTDSFGTQWTVTQTVTTPSGCNWSVSGVPSWITINSGSSGTGTGTINFTVAANPGIVEQYATLTVGNVTASNTFNVAENGENCSFTVTPSSATFPSGGGTGSYSVTTTPECFWAPFGSATWFSATDTGTTAPWDTSGIYKVGNGSVDDIVQANTGAARTATQGSPYTFSITQAGAVTEIGPTNGATCIPLSPTLSWNASSGATSYSIYFGTSSPPPFVTNVSTTTYSPGPLNSSTTYYWTVVANINTASIDYPTVSFTTTGVPPAPAGLSPANGATGVSLSPTLSWNACTCASSYDIYFGTSSPPPFVTNVATTTYSSGSLNAFTTYYWMVVAKNGVGSNSSPTISFTTTGAVPQTTLTCPSGTTTPTQPVSVSLALGAPTTTALGGTLTITCQPNAAGVPSSTWCDPATQFVGGNTTLDFTIPAGATTATLPQDGDIQQGTVATTITVTLTQLVAGSTNVLPQTPPSCSITVPPMAPVIEAGSVEITGLSSTGFTVGLNAYSTPRGLANATFTFLAAGGAQLDGTTSFVVQLGGIAPSYFSSASGQGSGGTFSLAVPFTFSGDTSALGSVSVTLSNSQGASSPQTGEF
jgi:hypothetical protein